MKGGRMVESQPGVLHFRVLTIAHSFPQRAPDHIEGAQRALPQFMWATGIHPGHWSFLLTPHRFSMHKLPTVRFFR
jgi:hypothetical protein